MLPVSFFAELVNKMPPTSSLSLLSLSVCFDFFVKRLRSLVISLYFSSKKALNILSCVTTFFTSSKIFDFLTEKKTAFKKAYSNNRFILIIIQTSVPFDVISQVSKK